MKLKVGRINTKSNYLSFFRLLLSIPAFFLLDFIHDSFNYRYILVAIYMLAYITDLLDGYLARKFDEVTEFGKIIDPLADKILTAVIIIKLFMIGEIPEFYFWVIILRDVLIFIGGLIVSNMIGRVLPSNLLGKLTISSIGFFIIGITLNVESIPVLYNILYYLSLTLSFVSIIGYGIRAFDSIKWTKNETI